MLRLKLPAILGWLVEDKDIGGAPESTEAVDEFPAALGLGARGWVGCR
jgi:hypothetical protein